MTVHRHKITLTTYLFEDLLRQNEKSIMLSGESQMHQGNLLKISEVFKESGILTGRHEEFIITQIIPMSSSVYKGLSLLKLRKYYEFQ